MRLLSALCLTILAAGCSSLTPFATQPRALELGKVEPRPRVAVCFNPLKTSSEEVQKLGQAECLGDTIAEQTETDYRLDDCPALTPGRATFVCSPKSPPKSGPAPTAK